MARLVGSDRQTDVALLKIDADGLPVAAIGDSSQLAPGDWVAARFHSSRPTSRSIPAIPVGH